MTRKRQEGDSLSRARSKEWKRTVEKRRIRYGDERKEKKDERNWNQPLDEDSVYERAAHLYDRSAMDVNRGHASLRATRIDANCRQNKSVSAADHWSSPSH